MVGLREIDLIGEGSRDMFDLAVIASSPVDSPVFILDGKAMLFE